MRGILVKVNGKEYQSVWLENGRVKMIDQRALPFEFKIIETNDWMQTAQAINGMTIRGAGSIGAASAFGMVQSIFSANDKNFLKNARIAAAGIKKTRPTAHDLFFAVDAVLGEIEKSDSAIEARAMAKQMADKIFWGYVESGKKIAEHGNALLGKNARILTHCNAGWLALVEWGSATAPIYLAQRKGKNPFVFVDETRPRGQGRLTAWELSQEKVRHALIADNAAGHFLSKGEIDLVITGADRIASNGDTANKIGTYEKAVLAKENSVPFFIAAPLNTFDLKTKSGAEIEIEHRNPDEVLFVEGQSGKGTQRVKIVWGKTKALNPAFDITPSKYITGIITPKGIVKPNRKGIAGLFS